MLKNYLNMLFRGIWKNKAFSAINITGLVIGITCCLMILLYVQYELSYDRYHQHQDRIYRISLHGVLAGLLAVSIAFVTVSLQSARAALTNPVLTLRNDC